MTPEGRMKKKVDTVLKEFGVWYFSPQTGGYGKSGVPDRVGCLKGRMVAVEVKAPEAKRGLTALQAKTINDMEQAGAYCFVVNNETSLAALRGWLRMIGNS